MVKATCFFILGMAFAFTYTTAVYVSNELRDPSVVNEVYVP